MPFRLSAALAALAGFLIAAGGAHLLIRVRPSRPEPTVFWAALLVGLTYAMAHCVIAPPSIPPGDVTDRIPFLALAAVGVCGLLLIGNESAPRRIAAYLGLAVLTYLVMLGPVLGSGPSPEMTARLAWAAGFMLLAAAKVAFLDVESHRADLGVALLVLSLGSSIALLLAGSAVLFQLAGLLAIILGGSLLGGRGRPGACSNLIAATLLMALILEGSIYAFLPAASALLLAAAPAALWATRFGRPARLHAVPRLIVAAVAAVIAVGAAVVWVVATRADDPYGY